MKIIELSTKQVVKIVLIIKSNYEVVISLGFD